MREGTLPGASSASWGRKPPGSLRSSLDEHARSRDAVTAWSPCGSHLALGETITAWSPYITPSVERDGHGLVTACHTRRWERQSRPGYHTSRPALGEMVTAWSPYITPGIGRDGHGLASLGAQRGRELGRGRGAAAGAARPTAVQTDGLEQCFGPWPTGTQRFLLFLEGSQALSLGHEFLENLTLWSRHSQGAGELSVPSWREAALLPAPRPPGPAVSTENDVLSWGDIGDCDVFSLTGHMPEGKSRPSEQVQTDVFTPHSALLGFCAVTNTTPCTPPVLVPTWTRPAWAGVRPVRSLKPEPPPGMATMDSLTHVLVPC